MSLDLLAFSLLMLLHLETHKLLGSKAVCSWPYEGLFAYFSLGKPLCYSASWFPTPERRGIHCHSISAALQVVLERSHGEPWLGFSGGVWVLPSQRALLPGGVREIANLCGMRAC